MMHSDWEHRERRKGIEIGFWGSKLDLLGEDVVCGLRSRQKEG